MIRLQGLLPQHQGYFKKLDAAGFLQSFCTALGLVFTGALNDFVANAPEMIDNKDSASLAPILSCPLVPLHMFFPESSAPEQSTSQCMSDSSVLLSKLLMAESAMSKATNHTANLATYGSHVAYLDKVPNSPGLRNFPTWRKGAQLSALLPRILVSALCLCATAAPKPLGPGPATQVVVYNLNLATLPIYRGDEIGTSQKRQKQSDTDENVLCMELLNRQPSVLASSPAASSSTASPMPDVAQSSLRGRMAFDARFHHLKGYFDTDPHYAQWQQPYVLATRTAMATLSRA
jgi:hypothetical protein